MKEKVTHILQWSQSLLKMWQRYSVMKHTCSEQLQRYKEQIATCTKPPADHKQLEQSLEKLKTVSKACFFIVNIYFFTIVYYC